MRKFVTVSLAALFLASFGISQASAACAGHLKSVQTPVPQTVVDGTGTVSKPRSGG